MGAAPRENAELTLHSGECWKPSHAVAALATNVRALQAAEPGWYHDPPVYIRETRRENEEGGTSVSYDAHVDLRRSVEFDVERAPF